MADALPSPFDDGELYDLILGELPYAVDFYVDLARRARGPVLEIACGTGRITLPCLAAGAEVEGLDFSAAMLDTLRKKAAARGYSPTLHQADMADFRLPRKYALIAITFNAYGHNLTQDAQLRCLRLCREHLLPGGMLAFDAFFPGLGIIGAPENTRVLEAELKHPRTGLPVRVYDTRTFERVEQIQHSIMEIELLDAAGKIQSTHRCETHIRWVYKQEMALLLKLAGFERVEICGDFERRPLTRETDGMVVVAWA